MFSSEGKPVNTSAFSGGRRGPSGEIYRLRWSGERDRVCESVYVRLCVHTHVTECVHALKSERRQIGLLYGVLFFCLSPPSVPFFLM